MRGPARVHKETRRPWGIGGFAFTSRQLCQDPRDVQSNADRLNEALAARLQEEGAQVLPRMRAILRNLAEAHIETARLNTLLPGDVERIKTADSIARAREALPRKNIREKEIDLWVRIETGMPIPDQTAVTDLGNGIGTIPSASNAGIFKCAKRRYRQVEYQPEEVAERVEPLIAVLRLPHFDRPGFAWNGGHVRNPQAALELLDRNERGSKRQVLTELVAEAPWTTPVIQRPSPQTNKAAAVSGD